MNRIPKEKRDKLLLIAVGTALVSLALYYIVIGAQKEQILETADKIVRTLESLGKDERWIRQAGIVRANLETSRKEIEVLQADMAPLDKFKWFYNTIEGFRSGYNVNLVDITRDPEIGPVGISPEFPYEAATFGVKISATYHDFGKFLADFENAFPFMRAHSVRLELDPRHKLAGTNSFFNIPADQRERLAITMKVVTLVKPTTPL